VRNDPQLNAHFVRELVLEPADNQRLANLCGQFDEHLQQIERRLGVSIRPKGNRFEIEGPQLSVQAADRLLTALFEQSASENISPQRVHAWLQESGVYEDSGARAPDEVRTRRAVIRGRGPNQAQYLQSMREKDLCFGIGPAGTGKTYLAVARAVEALEHDEVRRIVLVRPAVEAGERLGFLPGDLSQKVDPYLRPMYDALYEMVGFERVAKLIERHVIEIAPLAFMRGRTLNEAFVILDEAQNSTVEQMKMFLTRIGFGSRAVVNGDVTQTDLPATKSSGLRQAIEVLKDVEGVGFTYFTAKDVVRHPLVQRIVEAYQRHQGSDG
jgi:phosphate starvation-inducible protein PhoH and related proteins